MSEEVSVSIESDSGTKNQWARGVFYQQDGKKRTLVPKRLLWVAGISFAVLTIAIVIQGSPEPMQRTKADSIAAPEGIQAQTITNIPAVAQSDGGDAVKSTSPNSSGKSGGQGGDRKKKFTGPQLVKRPGSGKIPPGSFLKATLLTGASNGLVRAEVTEGLTLNGETLVEQGTILLGSGQSGEDRLAIRFSQMVYKDGAFDTIDGQACDAEDKIVGLKGSKVGSQALKLATGIGLNFVGGMTTALQDTQGQGGAVVTKPTLKNAMLNGAATASLDQGREMMSDLRNKTPAIEVPAGTLIYVLLQGN
jgi:hypothetical protein